MGLRAPRRRGPAGCWGPTDAWSSSSTTGRCGRSPVPWRRYHIRQPLEFTPTNDDTMTSWWLPERATDKRSRWPPSVANLPCFGEPARPRAHAGLSGQVGRAATAHSTPCFATGPSIPSGCVVRPRSGSADCWGVGGSLSDHGRVLLPVRASAMSAMSSRLRLGWAMSGAVSAGAPGSAVPDLLVSVRCLAAASPTRSCLRRPRSSTGSTFPGVRLRHRDERRIDLGRHPRKPDPSGHLPADDSCGPRCSRPTETPARSWRRC